MPDGRLVSEAEARKLAAQQSVNTAQPASSLPQPQPVQQNAVTPQPTPTQPKAKLSRRERKAQHSSVDEQQPLDTPCRQSGGQANCPLP